MIDQVALLSANAIPIERGSRLRVEFWNPSDASAFVQAVFKILLKDGSISTSSQQIVVPVNQSNFVKLFTLTDGHLLAVTLFTFSSIRQSGELYGFISLQNASVDNPESRLPLRAGYISAEAPLAYPLGLDQATNDGPGANLVQTDNPPAAGNELDITLPFRFFAELTGGSFRLTTSATVADRIINFIITDFNGTVVISQANAAIAAGTIADIFFWFATIPAAVPTNVRYIPLPKLTRLRAVRIQTITTGLQAGDLWDTTNIYFNAHVTP